MGEDNPKRPKLKKFIERPDRTLILDSSYVDQDAWDDDPEPPQDNVPVMYLLENNSCPKACQTEYQYNFTRNI